jgi:Ferritin-like domain
MFKTKNDPSEGIRAKAVEMLNAWLADCIDLQTQAKQAHWNVKGLHFIALHELFDGINEDLEVLRGRHRRACGATGRRCRGNGPDGGEAVHAP